ncbi:hypothetical protein Y032_0031g2257 [Ancylostoma ceylanicum]|uniref:Uncharacterized protein n=1 Tax=Ancylostoma ceylanicum TaxID=53326 RepID=A0A016UQH7_9BILA|nr:hypothetical protein Y032_0031g2257 [Ancylostoma ceylanicum]
MVSGRTVKEVGVFAGLIVVMHYAYYTIQNNPSLVAPEQRSELFYGGAPELREWSLPPSNQSQSLSAPPSTPYTLFWEAAKTYAATQPRRTRMLIRTRFFLQNRRNE